MKQLLTICLFAISFYSCKKSDSDIQPSSTVIFSDALIAAKNNWFVGSSSDYDYMFDQGSYSIKVKQSGYFYYATTPYSPINFPYSAQVDVKVNLDDTQRSAAVGIIFNRIDDTNFSYVSISNIGTYYVGNCNNGNYTTIVANTFSSVIKQGNNVKNTIAINQNKKSIDVIINYTRVGSFPLLIPTKFITVGPLVKTYSGVYYTPAAGLFNNFKLTKQ